MSLFQKIFLLCPFLFASFSVFSWPWKIYKPTENYERTPIGESYSFVAARATINPRSAIIQLFNNAGNVVIEVAGIDRSIYDIFPGLAVITILEEIFKKSSDIVTEVDQVRMRDILNAIVLNGQIALNVRGAGLSPVLIRSIKTRISLLVERISESEMVFLDLELVSALQSLVASLEPSILASAAPTRTSGGAFAVVEAAVVEEDDEFDADNEAEEDDLAPRHPQAAVDLALVHQLATANGLGNNIGAIQAVAREQGWSFYRIAAMLAYYARYGLSYFFPSLARTNSR